MPQARLSYAKKDIVESLAKYYEVPGVVFDNTTPIPGELLKKLKALTSIYQLLNVV